MESSAPSITNTTAPAAIRKLIDIIREHHGNTLVYYFYCKQVEQMGESEIVRSYRVTQKVTISPGEVAARAHAEVVSTARIKR